MVYPSALQQHKLMHCVYRGQKDTNSVRRESKQNKRIVMQNIRGIRNKQKECNQSWCTAPSEDVLLAIRSVAFVVFREVQGFQIEKSVQLNIRNRLATAELCFAMHMPQAT